MQEHYNYVLNLLPQSSKILYHALKSKYSGLMGHWNLAAIINNSNYCGYSTLYQLAVKHNHPALADDHPLIVPPHQYMKESLQEYAQCWLQHMQLQNLKNIIYSQCYFVHMFLHGMHPDAILTFSSPIMELLNKTTEGQPVVPNLKPNTIPSKIIKLAHHFQYNLDPHHPTTGGVQHGIYVLTAEDTSFTDFDPDILECIVQALSSTEDLMKCYLCGKGGHMLYQCPHHKELMDDAATLHMVLALLHSASNDTSGSHPCDQAPGNQTPHDHTHLLCDHDHNRGQNQHQLEANDADNAASDAQNDNAVASSNSDTNTDGQADPDFP